MGDKIRSLPDGVDPLTRAMLAALVADPSDEASRLALCDLLSERDYAAGDLAALSRAGGWWWSRFFEGSYCLVYCHGEGRPTADDSINVVRLRRKEAPRCSLCGATRHVWASAATGWLWRCDPPNDWLMPWTKRRVCPKGGASPCPQGSRS